MKQVAKLIIVDGNDKYLLLRRSDHPIFGKDADLPGGTIEDGEIAPETMMREVQEEIGVTIDKATARKVYAGVDFSKNGTLYSLYVAKLSKRPNVVMSWEHFSYRWLDRETFLKESKNAKDTYMHMVYAVMK